MEAHGNVVRRFLALPFCVGRIWSTYITQGVIQEKFVMYLTMRMQMLLFWLLAGPAKIVQNDSRIPLCIPFAGGVSTFALLKIISKLAHPNASLGYGLCFLNLVFDGFTNATQDSLKARYPNTSAWGVMLGMNLWGTIYNIIYMFVLPSGSGFEAVRCCKQHPNAVWDIFLYSCCGGVGQNFIFVTINRFGSLVNTTITTTGKFVCIVLSSLLSANPLSTKQWGCILMVFSGLSYQIYLKWHRLQKRKTM